ncbi:MAG TPA: HAD-IA family hydrolase [Steroidobacteraceae bacterium]|nr:HAD-IA family hydrolase [Steroidobacteraceae bacterium]
MELTRFRGHLLKGKDPDVGSSILVKFLMPPSSFPRRPHLVIFDWDGTLFDGDFLLDEAITRVCKQKGRHEIRTLLAPMLFKEGRTLPLPMLPLDPAMKLRLIADIYKEQARLEAAADVFPGITQLLDRLASAKVLIAIATGSSRARFETLAARTKVLDRISASVCAAETKPKPHPEMLEHLMAKLSIEREVTLYVGNSQDDCAMAKHARVPYCSVSFCRRAKEARTHGKSHYHANSVESLARILE